MDDSVMNDEETVISPSMEAVVEENLEDMSHEEEAIASRLTSTVARKSLRQSVRPPVNMNESLFFTLGFPAFLAILNKRHESEKRSWRQLQNIGH